MTIPLGRACPTNPARGHSTAGRIVSHNQFPVRKHVTREPTLIDFVADLHVWEK
jgi:hypothetical protein